jgi:hypothetical protein
MATPGLWFQDPRCKDIRGQTFNRLTAIEPAQRPKHWLCRCRCGTLAIVSGKQLRNGMSRSCGCLSREASAATAIARSTHGHSRGGKVSTEYKIWDGMITRCHSPAGLANPNYGGRGIKVCHRWRYSFKAFFSDMGPRPSKLHTIDRINNNGDYEPDNCRWATRSEQASNRRSSQLLSFMGKTMTTKQWAIETNLPAGTIYQRIGRGWTAEMALTRPLRITKATNVQLRLEL